MCAPPAIEYSSPRLFHPIAIATKATWTYGQRERDTRAAVREIPPVEGAQAEGGANRDLFDRLYTWCGLSAVHEYPVARLTR